MNMQMGKSLVFIALSRIVSSDESVQMRILTSAFAAR